LDQYNASATFFITGNNNGQSYFKVLVLVEITDIETRQRTNR
jgi:peptidoglycan/xylan/chitin deacetylase (PgdA/CDA1 family)